MFEKGEFVRVEDFVETLARSPLANPDIPNTTEPISEALNALRKPAVEKAQMALIAERAKFKTDLDVKLAQQQTRLDDLRQRHEGQLAIKFGEGRDGQSGWQQQGQKERAQSRVEKLFADQARWVEESMTTEPEPYIKIIAVLKGSDE